MRIPTVWLLLFGACSPADPASTDGTGAVARGFSPVSPSAPAVDSRPPVASTAVAPPAPKAACRAEMVLAGTICVDRYEAHLRVGDRIHPHQERPREGERYVAASAPNVFPQAYISRVEAADACAAAGKRLCSRTEWAAACRGTRPDACNRGKSHLLPILFPEAGWSFSYERHFNSPAPSLEPGYLARTGEHDACVSEAGAHDMVGNLHEWISDPVTREFIHYFKQEMPRQWQPVFTGNGIFMGGFYSTTNEHGAGCAFTTVAHEPRYHDYSTGFRCCAGRR